MAQNVVDFSIDPSGEQLLDTLLTGMQNNVLSSNSGSSRPSYAQNGTVWVDQTTTPWVWKMFNGTDDVPLGDIDPTSLHFTPSNIPQILDNLNAVAAPTVNDDSNDGYEAGSKWFYNGDIWLCVDATVGAAVWVDTGVQLTDLGTLAVLDEVAFANIATGAIASQAEAEAGTATDKLMTPERTAQAIDAQVSKGAVVQTVENVDTAISNVSITGTGWTAGGQNVSITATTGNKIRVYYDFQCGLSTSTMLYMSVYKDGVQMTEYIGDTRGSRARITKAVDFDSNNRPANITGFIDDIADDGLSHTYSFRWRAFGSATLYFNKISTDSDTASYFTAMSKVVAEEIKT